MPRFGEGDRLRDRTVPGRDRGPGRMDNTLIFYITGDNGRCSRAARTVPSTRCYCFNAPGAPRIAFAEAHWTNSAGPMIPYPIIPMAGPAPVPRRLLGAMFAAYGGFASPLVVSLAQGITKRGASAHAVASHDRHRADGLGGRRIARARGRAWHPRRNPIQGVSMLYTFDDPAAATARRHTQYFEMAVIAASTRTAGSLPRFIGRRGSHMPLAPRWRAISGSFTTRKDFS